MGVVGDTVERAVRGLLIARSAHGGFMAIDAIIASFVVMIALIAAAAVIVPRVRAGAMIYEDLIAVLGPSSDRAALPRADR